VSCKCQNCGRQYKVDLLIPDNIWEKIRPLDKPPEAGLLCGSCIMSHIELYFKKHMAFKIIDVEDIKFSMKNHDYISDLCYVDVVETETRKLEKRMGPYCYRIADRTKDHLNDTINHDRYQVEISPKCEVDDEVDNSTNK